MIICPRHSLASIAELSLLLFMRFVLLFCPPCVCGCAPPAHTQGGQKNSTKHVCVLCCGDLDFVDMLPLWLGGGPCRCLVTISVKPTRSLRSRATLRSLRSHAPLPCCLFPGRLLLLLVLLLLLMMMNVSGGGVGGGACDASDDNDDDDDDILEGRAGGLNGNRPTFNSLL